MNLDEVTSPAMRYHGGKFRLAPWVMRHFPPHRVYVEPFGGAAGVLMRKPRAYSEVYNDMDGDLVNFFRVMQDAGQRQRLIESVVMTPYAREEFEVAWQPSSDPVENARRLVIRAQMGFGSAGATKGTTGFRIDTKREYETAQHVWAQYPANLQLVGLRLTGVLIENRPAIDVIKAHDTPDTLFYVDPPYVHETRCRISSKESARGYRHEMDHADHLELIDVLSRVRGMVVLSGYENPTYSDALDGWEKHSTAARISGNRGAAVRMETVWLNQACSDAIHGGALFSPMRKEEKEEHGLSQ